MGWQIATLGETSKRPNGDSGKTAWLNKTQRPTTEHGRLTGPSPRATMTNSIFFCQPDRAKLPAQLDTFTYGNTGYLSIHSDDHKLHVALAGNAAALVLVLRQAADELERKFFMSDHYRLTKQAEEAKDWKWLTPEMVIRYFELSPILKSMAADVREVLKPLSSLVTVTTQLELDLETVKPHLKQIMPNGKVNKSEIARVLNISPGGAKNWPRVNAVAEVISSSSSLTARAGTVEENAMRDAA
jgi:hypothetical protein